MSKPLKQNCTDFQALKFFEQCRDQIHKIAKSYNQADHYKKQLSKVHKRVNQLEPQSQNHSQQSNQNKKIERMLLNNIIIDYLSSCKYNYTYPVFMRECNIISEEIVNKKRLSTVVGLQEQYCNNERFDISILQLMVQKIQKLSTKNKQMKQEGTQVQIIKRNKQQNNPVILQNKFRQIREQVERNQKKFYQKQLQSLRSKQILELRSQISKQFEEKYNKQRQKVSKKYQELIQKSRSMSNNSSFEQQNVKLLNKNYQLSQQVSKLKKSLQQSQLQKSKHSCLKSPQYIEQTSKLTAQRRQLQRKKQQFDSALRGISSKIQDIAQQKITLQINKNGTEQFVNDIKVHRENKDYMIQSLYSQMKKMDNRVKVLSQENGKLRQTIKQQNRKIRDQQGSILQLKQKQKSLPTSSIINQLNQLRQESFIDVEMTMNIDRYIHNQNIKNNEYNHTIPTNNYGNLPPSGNPKTKRCKQCKNLINNKPITITVSTNVTQDDLIQQIPIDKHTKQKQQLKQDIKASQSESDFSLRQDTELQHKNRLAKLRADMKLIKNKVLLLVNIDNY